MGKPRFHKKAVNDNRARNNPTSNPTARDPVTRLRNRTDRKLEAVIQEATREIESKNRLAPVTDPEPIVSPLVMEVHGLRFGYFHKDTEPTGKVERYNSVTAEVCRILGVAYGAVGVADRPDPVVSHEPRYDSGDSSCFFTQFERKVARHDWDQWQAQKAAKEEALARRLQEALETCGI